ncbi:MAG: Fic family protein [Planctomycetales bacterium]|nr:Fic family protein [Planctomycetales bacterium]
MSGKKRLGTYIKRTVGGESYGAFMPPALPPDPPINVLPLSGLLAKASAAVGRLDGVANVLPDRGLFLYYYVRKEAVLSSQIEGTQSSLSDLLLYESDESPAVPLDDVVEVSRYVAALEHGLKRIEDGFPLSLRLIREMHEILLSKGRGSHQTPGEFRKTQNWIGGSRPGNAMFVPPPPERLMECLDSFEKYLNCEERVYSSLIDAGLIHVQFETIHPFLDGNGRIGRLLITFYLIVVGDMQQPWLYLSLFFRNNREEYYRRLNAVRATGDWEGWLDYFLQGVAETADQVVELSKRISDLFAADKEQISVLKRAAVNTTLVHGILQHRAITSATEAARQLNISVPTARAALQKLKSLGIVEEIRGKGKERLYVYTDLLALLERGVD